MKEKKRIKPKIGVGSLVKAKARKMEENTREGRSRRTRKDVVGCVHIVDGKKKFLALFEYGQKEEIGYCPLVYLSEKEEVDMEELISHLPEKKKAYC